MTNHQGTLAQPAVASLLARLFGESERSDRELREMLGKITPEERTRWMTDPEADYRKLYGNAKDDIVIAGSTAHDEDDADESRGGAHGSALLLGGCEARSHGHNLGRPQRPDDIPGDARYV